ncbi:LysR family transcriptional regulator [Carnimonas nigrificans]|uniref:LysR family transcriptional regulator n=1 Tax=Carnimonas nigrificans TaxID=64323 RepID=UPI000471315E|nr:LysR family transcriptional regulator [Carnimonas nigrificans]
MQKLDSLAAFVAVARAGNFTRAAEQLRISQSALSQSIRKLEHRLGVSLFIRTTRSVSVTQAGEKLLEVVGPRLDEITQQMEALSDLRETPAGRIRLTATEHAAETILWPVLQRILPSYPDIKVEVAIDYGLTDIAAEGFDAGIRPRESISPGMVALPLGPPMRMAVVASPGYFSQHPPPAMPEQLTEHCCINLRLPQHGLYAWEFDHNGRSMQVHVDGQLTFNNAQLMLKAAVDGLGIAYVLEEQATPFLAEGKLVRILGDWCEQFPGYYLYYPNRKGHSAAFTVLLDELKRQRD